jgi:hypothetical protein
MSMQPILWPGFAMVVLTFVVMCRMYYVRIAQMRRERIHPQRVATSAQSTALLTDSAAADNFRNLFELPVLFYFALATAALTNQVTVATLALAWTFVALRVAHSFVQCTYNKVMHRFQAYLMGAAALLLLWLRLGYGLLAG